MTLPLPWKLHSSYSSSRPVHLQLKKKNSTIFWCLLCKQDDLSSIIRTHIKNIKEQGAAHLWRQVVLVAWPNHWALGQWKILFQKPRCTTVFRNSTLELTSGFHVHVHACTHVNLYTHEHMTYDICIYIHIHMELHIFGCANHKGKFQVVVILI